MNWLTTESEHINRMDSPHKCMLKNSIHPACILQASKHSSNCGNNETRDSSSKKQKHVTVHVHTDSLSKRLDLIGSRWKLAEWMGSLLFSISCYFQHDHLAAEAEEQLAETNSSVFVILKSLQRSHNNARWDQLAHFIGFHLGALILVY